MRLLLLPLLSLTLLAQTPVHKTAAPKAAPVMKNFRETGSASAPLTFELYTDYQCPACRNFFLTVLPTLTADYIATGKVRLIHRDFPLPQHTYSKVAARWANAAGQVGKYEVVATQIFKTQMEWEGNGNIEAEVAKVVSPAELVKIKELVKNDTHLDDSVTADVALGNRDGLNQTPTEIIVDKHGKRNKIDGPMDYPILKSYLDQLLAKN
jgi:protein-disulfide isomerase